MEAPAASHRGGFQPVTLPEAARILGVSESTVRRLVKAGKLEAERVLRPQGYVWMVAVPAPSADPPGTRRQVGTAEGNHPPGSDALTAWTRSVLEPLVAELSLSRQTIERQAEQIADLREARGRLLAELEHARQPPADAPESRSGGPERAESGRMVPESTPAPSGPWWRRLWASLLGAPG